MEPAEIQKLIETHVPDCRAQVSSDDQTHYEAIVVSDAFAGKRPIQRHQLVYAALGQRMGREIHALSIQAYTADEWAERSA